MNTTTLTWVVVGALVTALAILEPDFGEYLTLWSIRMRQWFELQWFWLRSNPRLPWVRLMIEVRSQILARKLLKELQNGLDSGDDTAGKGGDT
jgi:hypothetical protein